MKLTIDIPDAIGPQLQAQLGPNLAQVAKETVAVGWYLAEKISIGQVAELLGMSLYEAQGFLKARGVTAPFSAEDYDQDKSTLHRLLKS